MKFEKVLPAFARGTVTRIRRVFWRSDSWLRIEGGRIVADAGSEIGVRWESPETDILRDDWEVLPREEPVAESVE